MAYLLRTDGSISEVHPADGAVFSLSELQGYVGGYIEIIHTHTGDLLVCNEMGKLQGLPRNEQATERYRFGTYDPVVGDVLIATFAELQSDDEDDDDETGGSNRPTTEGEER